MNNVRNLTMTLCACALTASAQSFLVSDSLKLQRWFHGGEEQINMPLFQTKYTADPSPLVVGDTLFLYTSHDSSPEDIADPNEKSSAGFFMYDWLLWSTTDMVNWTEHGAVASLKEFPWRSRDNGAWAIQTVERNGKYYLYAPLHGHGIGVLVSDSPYGPFKDPLGKPLVWQKDHWDDIDPTVYIDDDGQAYMYWGNPNTYYVLLNDDMISLKSDIVKLDYHIEHYQEGPWFYKRNGLYYLSYATTCCPEALGYAMSYSPTGPWEPKGYIMQPTERDRGNHPGIVDYKGHSYIFGQNYDLMHLETFVHHERRSVSATEITYLPDGTIEEVPYWLDQQPMKQLHAFNPYQRVEAETMAWGYGLKTAKMGIPNTGIVANMPASTGKRNMYVYDIDNNEYIRLRGVDFGLGAQRFSLTAAAKGKCTVTLRLDSREGPVIGTLRLTSTTGLDRYQAFETKIKGAAGIHDLYLCFSQVSGDVRLDWWQFTPYASTTCNADGTVTFRYRNDQAKEVLVDVQFAGRNPMQRDAETGLWTATLGPAAPDMYPYCFIVDGVSIMDPACEQYFPNEGFKNSLLEIPARDTALPHDIKDVPHGDIDYIHYYSKSLGATNEAVVCLPPGYAQHPEKKYPVFYLISGTTDTEEVYYKVGRVNYILDNLLAEGKAEEMIVVLPYGNPYKLLPTPPEGMFGAPGSKFGSDVFSLDLNNDLMPYIEQHYRTINDADHRAIGGFSRGGNQALFNGLSHLDKFSYLCSYSSFTSTDIPDVYDNADDTNSKINLFWLGVGTDDFLYGNARDYMEFLDKHGIRSVKEYTTDKFGHTWMNAKYFLSKTLPLLFRPETAKETMKNAQPTLAATGKEAQFTPGVMARLFPKPIVSPEFGSDSVTFRLKAPEATKVALVTELQAEPITMQKDADGIWAVTLEDITTDAFTYYFCVDGTPTADPQNMYLAPSKGFKPSVCNNNAGAYYYPTAGEITYGQLRYDLNKGVACFTPGGIQSANVLIRLIPGEDDTMESWFKMGGADVMADKLLAQGRTQPCILTTDANRQPSAGQQVYTLRADDYPTWPARRKALEQLLVSLNNVEKKWTEKQVDNFRIVSQEDGPTLGYAPQSGVRLLTIDGLAFKDLNRNNSLDPYEDWRLSAKERAADLASKLSLEEIAGLMLYSSHQPVPAKELTADQKKFLKDDHLRAVLITSVKSPTVAAQWNNQQQAFVEGLDHGIPANTSSDPRHETQGNAEFNAGAGGQISLWPSSLGLAATFDPLLVKQFGEIASEEYRALGIATALSPQIDIATEPRWWRFSGTFGENPLLVTDMARAYCEGFQTTPGTDGWGLKSVNAMVKHWYGYGAQEAGRDSHFSHGKFAVYPGNNLAMHKRPFAEGAFNLKGGTKMASAVMPIYSIVLNQDPSGENVGGSYSKWLIQEQLRDGEHFEGVICTDWGITNDYKSAYDPSGGKPWGVEDLTVAERHYRVLQAGVDQFGGNNEIGPIIEAYQMWEKDFGKEKAQQRFQQSAQRLLLNIFRVGLFENPYLDPKETDAIVGKPAFMEAGYDAQLRSIVMLKNHQKALPAQERSKVYIPKRHYPSIPRIWGPPTEDKTDDPISPELVKRYFDIAETPEEAAFAICVIGEPSFSLGYSLDEASKGGNGYLPISLQYEDYTATDARAESIGGGDPLESFTNRTYKGKTVKTLNRDDMLMIRETKKLMGDKPVIVIVEVGKPLVLKEIEPSADAILLSFGVQYQALLEIISGQQEPTALLPFQMPADMKTVETQKEDVPGDMRCYKDADGHSYDFAFGLGWKGVIKDQRVKRYRK